MGRLDGRVAIVTGGASGMGRACCLGLAKEGATVVVADILDAGETVEEVKALGSKGLPVHVDVTKEEPTMKMAVSVAGEFGRIDILVNNAGIYPKATFAAMDFSDWKRVLAVDLDGVFLCTKAVYPFMVKQRFGRIVNISSDLVFMGSTQFVHYASAKAGVMGFTNALAAEAGEYGITVNAIAPGLVATETVLRRPGGAGFEFVVPMQAINRRQEPEDIVGAVLFFVSDEGSFVTGQTIAVDGGLTRH